MSLYQSLNTDYGKYFDVASACLAVTSATLWLASARVGDTSDVDAELNAQMRRRVSALNAGAASISAVAAVAIAAKTFFVAP